MNNFHMREGKVEFRWKRWRNKKRQEVSSCLMVLFSGMVLLGAGGVALAGPTGGQITGGTGSINQTGPTTNVDQTSNVLNINWQDFSIGVNETVNFNQPDANALAINRVIGGVPSQLAGALNANGRVFILNSAGITFTGTSHVNVGALLATTAMTVNGDPTLAASYSGSGYGSVVNQGSIVVSNGGFAILAAPYVQNTGFIKADLGTIALAGTNQFTLDLSGTGLINFVVPAGTVEQIVADGKALGVDNSGTLQARSGQVIISANVATQVVNAVVNLNGVVDADAFAPNGTGGSVLVTGAGDINIGGQVTARGDGTGAGGQIVTKAGGADAIEALAFVSAAGGAGGGKGGFIEVSGKTVGLNGNIDPGNGGLLYVDPATFIIRNNSSGQSPSGIGEHKLEQLLQNGAGFSVDVAGDITIQNLTDNLLAGGPGDLTLTAGTGGAGAIIVQGTNDVIRTGGGDVRLTAAGNIGDAGHRLSFVSGTAIPGVTQAGDIVLNTTNNGNIFVKNVTVKSAGNSAFHALFSANAAHSFDAAGLIDVEALACGFGGQTADAEIHINAGNGIALHGITDRATAFKNAGLGHNVFATASVTLNGTQLHDTGAMTVTANVGGRAANSFDAEADLDITNAGTVDVTGGALNVNARANVFSASNVFADATAHIDPVGPVTLNSVFVHANVQADKVACAHAIASFNASGSKISIANDAIVNATANNSNLGRTASATANLFLTATLGKASVGGNVSVTALAIDGGGSQDADAFANLGINAHGAVVVDGDVTVTANAQTLQVLSGDSSTPNASAIANIDAFAGGIHLLGNLDVEAVASSLNTDSVTAIARARLNAFNGLGSSIASIQVDGTTKVLATAKTNAQSEFISGCHAGALASASLYVHAEGHVNMGAIAVKASASDLGRFQANAIAHANIISVRDSISISGGVDVEANAQDPVGSYASANAEANIQASGDIDILGNVQVNATAQQNNGGTSTGGAFACANLHIDASSSAEGGQVDVNVNGNIGVHALAETNGSGSATANAEAELSADASDGGDVTVNGSIGVTATANQLSNSGEGALACANLDIDVASHSSSAAVINVNGAVTVDAFARSNGASSVTANAQAEIGGHGTDLADGSSSSSGTAVNVTIHGDVDVSATANHVGTGAGAALALANLDIDASSSNVNVNGNIGVHANAQTNGTGAFVSSFFDSSTSRFYGAAAVARAEIAAEKGGSSQFNPSSAGNVTVNGNIEVTAIANQLNTRAGDGALACAGLDMDASFSFGDITVNGHIAVNAQAKDLGTGSAQANAFAGLDAEGSVLIHGNVNVDATANQLNTRGDSAQACANLQMDASASFFSGGDVNVNGDIGVSAVALAEGHSSAQANAVANIFAADAINITGNVEADASANQNGVDGSCAQANANLQLEAGSGDVNVNGDVTGSANAFSKGSSSAIANTFVNIHADSGDVIVNGVVTANAHAVANSTEDGVGAQANASMSIVGDPVAICGIIDHATATSHGIDFANAKANAHVTGSDVSIDGSVSLIAKAVDTNPQGDGAQANANLFIHASGHGVSSQLTITSDVTVLASANDYAHHANANAFACVELVGGGNDSRAVDLADVSVTANAFDNSGCGETRADAQLRISATSGESGGVHMGSLDVTASANELFGQANAHANALANAFINAHNTASATGHDVLVTANAFDGSSANANANLTITAGHVVLGNDSGSEFSDFVGPIGARAKAIADDFNAQAHALANVHITAGTGNASIFGTLEGIASASFNHHGGNALTDINASAFVHVNALAAGANIVVESINVAADAENWGDNATKAVGSLALNANASLFLEDTEVVRATADNHNSHANAAAIAATASALAHFNALQIHGESSQSIAVVAHAINAGHKGVKALTSLTFGNATLVDVGGITLDVLASELRSTDNGAGAKASAVLNQSNSVVHWSIGDHGINVQAVAHSHGTVGAKALASVNIHQESIEIGGPVTVNAEATANVHAAAGALASAFLILDATTGDLSVGENPAGSNSDIFVKANAHNLGGNRANALACAALTANDSEAGALYTENVTVEAFAFDANAHGDTKANAQLEVLDNNGGGVSVGSIDVLASAHEVNGTADAAAQALANAEIAANDFTFVEGGIAVVAIAQDPGGSAANASANLLVSGDAVFVGSGSRTFNFPNSAGTTTVTSANFGVFVAAVAIYNGHNSIGGHAQADANAFINANGSIDIEGGVDVQAFAHDDGGHSANADADLLVNGGENVFIGFGNIAFNVHGSHSSLANFRVLDGVFVGASASDGGEAGIARADANAIVQTANNTVNNVTIDGGAFVLADAFDQSGASANACATLLVVGHNIRIGSGQISSTSNLSGSLLHDLRVRPAAVYMQALAADLGHGSLHHANALAQANIDPAGLVQINGDVDLVALAFDNSGHGATANANLLIQASTIHINNGTQSSIPGNVFVLASAVESGHTGATANAFANVRILANGAGTDAISLNGITVAAIAFDDTATGGNDVNANAQLLLSADNGGVNMGGLNVFASASLRGANPTDAVATANAHVISGKQIHANGDILVTAFAETDATLAGNANADAELVLDAFNGTIDVEGNVKVNAQAVGGGSASALANALASFQANAITVNGSVDVIANADQFRSSGEAAHANASLDFDADTGSININGPVTVDATAETFGDADAMANANAELDASGTGNVTVNGNVDVAANAVVHSDGGQAHATANLDVNASDGNININGNIGVEADAFANGGTSGVFANALAVIVASGDVTVGGNIRVTANASYTGSDAGEGVDACANLDLDATSGSVSIDGRVFVAAFAHDDGPFRARANAQAEIAAENNGVGSSAGNVNVNGNIDVTATASMDNVDGDLAQACASLDIDASSGSINVNGNIALNANAQSRGSASAIARANAELDASSSITVNGNIDVTASANQAGTNGNSAQACANLGLDASLGDVTVNGHVRASANAFNAGSESALANANVGIFASSGDVVVRGAVVANAHATANSNSGSSGALANAQIQINGDPVTLGAVVAHATATSHGTGFANALANVELNAGGNVAILGGVLVHAAALDDDPSGDGALANANFRASAGSNLAIALFTNVQAFATYSGSSVRDADAIATIDLTAARNITIRGASAFADADAFHLANGDATATAFIDLDAGSSINVGTLGLFAAADANASGGRHAYANALIEVDAGSGGVGGVFLQGNAIVVAGAVGGSPGNTALANVHLAGGGATELGTGASGTFGNVVIIGNVDAFAFADATSDHANASVEIFAHNNILIVGDDPIASARLGPNGSILAFRQAHFTTNHSVTAPQGTATADIDIRAGGTVTVIPLSSLIGAEKLFALPVDQPTLDSNGLTIIPLSVDGQDCGVLGPAGATEDQLKKALECHKSPINVSDLTDVSP